MFTRLAPGFQQSRGPHVLFHGEATCYLLTLGRFGVQGRDIFVLPVLVFAQGITHKTTAICLVGWPLIEPTAPLGGS